MRRFPVLDETQRLQYLQTIGITSWLPTEALVGTKANDVFWCESTQQPISPRLAPIIVPTAPVPISQPMQPASSVQNALEQDTSAISGLSIRTQTSDKPHSVSALLELDTSSSLDANVPTFGKAKVMGADRLAPLHIGLSWYSNGVLIVNDIPVQEGAAMSSPIQRLQTAIVNAIRGETEDDSLQVMPAASMEFNWPLVPGPHADHSLVGAQSGLRYSLIKLLKDNQCEKILVMGPAAIKLLKPQMNLGEVGEIELFDKGVWSVYSHSLHQLLAVPSLKKETWNHLQPFLNAPSLA